MILGHGVYSYREAASLARLKQSRVREWFNCRSTTKVGAIFQSDYPGLQQKLISFLDLVDVFIAGQMREHGVSLQTLRKVYKTLQQDLSVEHPFGRRELLTDGKQVFMHGLDSKGRREVIEVLTKQRAFPLVILPFLRKLKYDDTSNLASQWNIAKSIVVNPQICFGQPIVEARGIPTTILARAAKANSVGAVAKWYGATPHQVKCAIKFEAELFKAA